MSVKMNDASSQVSHIILLISSALLILSGLVIGIGYELHLAGFIGLITLVVAGFNLFAAGIMWAAWRRLRWFALIVALVGAVMCVAVLPAQISGSAMPAAAINLGAIAAQLAAAGLLWQYLRRA